MATTKLEKMFFKHFGIEEIEYCGGKDGYLCNKNCTLYEVRNDFNQDPFHRTFYPDITIEDLLRLICILNANVTTNDIDYHRCKDWRCLKDAILKDCIYNKELIQKEVRKLFEEQLNERQRDNRWY
jgi:hypothetical protein